MALMAFLLLMPALKAQNDTIWVQTLTFDSITTRRGIWNFPEGETYREILMYYTLKCDPQTTHDKYDCGEWDYLTYSDVFDHTGIMDSTLYHQASFSLLNGQSFDSLELTNQELFYWAGFDQKHASFTDTLAMEEALLGSGASLNTNILKSGLQDSRMQFIYKAEELSAAGLAAGNINSLALFAEISEPVVLERLRIGMKQISLTEMSPALLVQDAQTVFFDSLYLENSGETGLTFHEAFEWDGSSNILLDLSFEYEGNEGTSISLKADDAGFKSGISTAKDDYSLRFDGGADYAQLEDGVYFNGDFTIEAWINKEGNTSWSRLIDFGNGPASDNVILALSQATSGKMNMTVYHGGTSKGFTTDEAVPMNGWNHVAVSMWNNIGKLYLNGEVFKMGLLQEPKDTIRENCYIGRSNWTNDKYAKAKIDELRIYNYAREPEEIITEMHTQLPDPELYPGLIAYYDFNEGEGNIIHDRSAVSYDGQSFGYPDWHRTHGHQRYSGFAQDNMRPKVSFRHIESSALDVIDYLSKDKQKAAATQLMVFEDDENPTIANDTIEVYPGGWQYVYRNGEKADSVYYSVDDVLYKQMIPYYGEPFEILDRWEIGRFITPYGINLTLGSGFTWIYDVTVYAHLLQGDVEFRAGNQQELIDVKFALIKGTPPRDVIQIQRPWGARSSQLYKNLDDDVVMFDTLLSVNENTQQIKMITRLTGHGHNSNNGEYPHCCEWKDNTHYLLVNGVDNADWHIWQTHDCALNPVYPQGGTWNGSREGWCPGDRVKDWEFEIGDQIQNGQISVDYDITPVPESNQGMGNGNYVMAFHMVEYGASNFELDAEVYDVITPNDQEYYSRKNPICADPKIKIRNNGTSELTSLTISYGISGREPLTYNWTGNLAPNHFETITLPVVSEEFWLGDGQNLFTVNLSRPNGQNDEYADNDSYTTHFTVPDLYSEDLVLHLKMNNQPYRYSITIKDINNEEVYSRTGMQADSLYTDTLNYADGCYTLELIDSEGMGLSYWAYPAQGSGYLRIFDTDGNRLKNFNGDFGRSIRYSFNLGNTTFIKEPNLDREITLYPNPASNMLNIRARLFEGTTNITAWDYLGKNVGEWVFETNDQLSEEINISSWAPGIYLFRIRNGAYAETKKIIVR